jgi:hypothetical protein
MENETQLGDERSDSKSADPKVPSDEDVPFHPSRMVRECLSWRLATEFMRRHPDFGTLIEAHPGGGQYDCLAFYRQGGLSLAINRCGSITFLAGDAMPQIDFTRVWRRGLEEDGVETILNAMSDLVRLSPPSPLPSTTSETLACRVITVIMSALIFDKKMWKCLNGQEDTSGYGDQSARDKWFIEFPAAEESRRQVDTDDPPVMPSYRFWFILRDETPLVCLSKQALWYPRNRAPVDLMAKYRKGSTIENLAATILATF